MIRRIAAVSAALLLLLCAAMPASAAGRIEAIQARGTLVVGVKTEYPPFGSLDTDGNIVGLEADMAAEIARRLHVQLRMVGVTTANRMQKLADGTVDMLIATLGDTPQRRQIATLISPDYYASGVNLMAPVSKKLGVWTDLQGQTVCSTQGAYFNRAMSQRYLFDLQLYNGVRDAMLALRDGRCAGWLYDDTAISEALGRPEWRDYAMPLPSLMVSPWAIAIRQGDDGLDLNRAVGDMIAEWHRTGYLLDLERKWHLQPSKYLQAAQAIWMQRTADGGYVCARNDAGEWPVACQDQVGHGPEAASGLQKLGMQIEDATGLDFSFVYDAYDRASFVRGLVVSIGLIVACVVGTVAVAGLGAIAVEARVPVASRLVVAITTFCRMTPPLLQLYVVVFGLGAITARWGFTMNAFFAAIACLSLYAGSASMMALIEAADVIRVKQPDYRITRGGLPGVFNLAYQPVLASLVNIVKATGMASAVAVPELISSSTAIIAERGNSAVMVHVLMVAYFVMVLVVMRLIAMVHRRVIRHVAA
jgi:polar amino acid transport system substrate-binding protein